MNLKHGITILSAVLVALVLFAGFGPVLGVPQSTAQAVNSIGNPVLAQMPALAGTLSTPTTATPMVAAGGSHTVGLKSDGTAVAVGYNVHGQCNVSGWSDIVQVSAGYFHTVGLKSDGTAVAVGRNQYGECNVSGWSDIIQVSAGWEHTVGLKSDGTAVAVGYNDFGQHNVSGWSGIVQIFAGYFHTVGLKSDGTVVAVGYNDYGQCNVSGWSGIVQVSAGFEHTVGLKSDGTVVAVGYNDYGQCEVSGWSGIVQVSAEYWHTVGLKSDGTAVAVGYNDYGQCNVSGWSGIVQVSAGFEHTVGLKSDGTAVAVGYNDYGQCNVSGWSGIVQVSAGDSHTVGLKSDGTAVAVGWNDYGQCNVSGWSGMVQVSAGDRHTVGLKSDGTAVAVGWNDYGQCNVSGWSGMVQVSAGDYHTVGLKSDGTVVAVGYNDYGLCEVSGWSGIVQVSAGDYHTVGLKSDGTAVAVGAGYNDFGQCNVSGWSGIVQVSARNTHTVGLKSDGTVVAVGYNDYGQCEVSGWNGMVQVSAGYWHTVGLKSDGTAVAVGWNDYGQCNVSGWGGMVQVSAGYLHTVGLKSDGTAVAAPPWLDTWDLDGFVASFTYSPHEVTQYSERNPGVNETVEFDASTSTDGEGTIVHYLWNFGDGSLLSLGKAHTHKFKKQGTYKVTLSVFDNAGNSDSTTQMVKVVPDWRKDIRSGDIVLETDALGGLGHAGIVYGTNAVIEAGAKFFDDLDGGVYKNDITTWDNKKQVSLLRVRDCDDSTAASAADLAYAQYKADPPKKYDYTYDGKSDDLSDTNKDWYCSELVWAVYKHVGFDLNPGPLAVVPNALITTSLTYVVGQYGFWDSVLGFSILGKCPIDLVLTDPDGLTVTRDSSGIPGSAYYIGDVNGDGSDDTWIGIPERKVGTYSVTVVPQEQAQPTDTYTLTSIQASGSSSVAQDVEIEDIPANPYEVESNGYTIIGNNHLFVLRDNPDVDVTVTPQTGIRWVLIEDLNGTPIAEVCVDFDQATSDIDLTGLTAITDPDSEKAVLHMDEWPGVIDPDKTLYVPSTGAGGVYVCPNATSMVEVSPEQADAFHIDVGQTMNGVSVSCTVINGLQYYVLSGIAGTGAAEDTRASTTTLLTTSVSPSTFGQPVTLIATVNPAPEGGTVQFQDNGFDLDSPLILNSSGQASYITVDLPIGGHIITAVYSGDALYALSSDSLIQMVNAATNTVPIEEALASIDGNYASVWGFDASSQTYNPYCPTAPPYVNTLESLSAGLGYWIHATQDCTLIYGGNAYPLFMGWNLIGWGASGGNVAPLPDALDTIADYCIIVWTFDAATKAWLVYDPTPGATSDIASLVTGQGYWSKVSEDCTLTYGTHTYDLKARWNLIGWLG